MHKEKTKLPRFALNPSKDLEGVPRVPCNLLGFICHRQGILNIKCLPGWHSPGQKKSMQKFGNFWTIFVFGPKLPPVPFFHRALHLFYYFYVFNRYYSKLFAVGCFSVQRLSLAFLSHFYLPQKNVHFCYSQSLNLKNLPGKNILPS